ncbi:G patch domain-containing protein 3-like [Physella acuta]|uniref:G patch domain-containing protein 3-like n=1 Tax=Physella acuta TaxID=109671 RepID=UPI0027DB937C|nr:G patch domain-containing protein 3-like [Physella acuta]
MDSMYAVVSNIPENFHTADLRAHFSSLIESKLFICFHFRHRPENTANRNDLSRNITRRFCCVVKIFKTRLQELMDYNEKHWSDVSGETLSDLCYVSPIKLKIKHAECANEQDAVEEEKLLQMPEMNPPSLMPNGNVGTPTLVFLDFIQKCLLPNNLIKKLKLQFPKTSARRLYGNVDFKYSCSENRSYDYTYETDNSNGNGKDILNSDTIKTKVWTCKPYLKQLKNLEACKSSLVANKSTENMNNQPCNHEDIFYSQPNSLQHSNIVNIIPLEAVKAGHSSHVSAPNITDTSVQQPEMTPENTSKENKIKTPEDQITFIKPSLVAPAKRDRHKTKADKRLTRLMKAEGIEEKFIAIDRKYHNDDDAEEWDRHEASEDDPSNQERNKERLYEEEIEQPWEKGGAGVNFYTDAVYWQQQEGDFDEQTTDDLDVDFSAYEEPGSGDMDIKDFLKIRQEERFRNGIDNTDMFSIGIGHRLPKQHNSAVFKNKTQPKIGAFECYSKGIGRKLLESQGWQEGQGLGRNKKGIAEALTGKGQKPYNKRGLGYVEKERVLYGVSRLKQPSNPPLITTVYDDPKLTDPKVPLLQRAELSTLKHRPCHLEKFN